MSCNVGKIDKTIRLLIGVVGGAAGIYFQSWWGLVALVPILTASLNWCPLYTLLGLSTCKTAEQS